MGKREAHIDWSTVIPEKVASVTGSTYEDYWLCAGGLSAVNAIGRQLRDLIKLGTDPMAYGGIKNGRRRGKREEYREQEPDSA